MRHEFDDLLPFTSICIIGGILIGYPLGLIITQDVTMAVKITIAGIFPNLFVMAMIIVVYICRFCYQLGGALLLKLENIKKINGVVNLLENHLKVSKFEVVDYRKPAPLKGTCPTSSSQDFRITVRSGQIILEN